MKKSEEKTEEKKKEKKKKEKKEGRKITPNDPVFEVFQAVLLPTNIVLVSGEEALPDKN